MNKRLEKTIAKIIEHGPSRVVINGAGEGWSPSRALREGYPAPTVIFVRDDGWSLGAPDGLIEIARRMWQDKWVAVIQSESVILYPEWLTLWGIHKD